MPLRGGPACATKKNLRFWPENPQSLEKTFVFPLIFAHFNLRYLPDLAIVPFGPDFSQGNGVARKIRRLVPAAPGWKENSGG